VRAAAAGRLKKRRKPIMSPFFELCPARSAWRDALRLAGPFHRIKTVAIYWERTEGPHSQGIRAICVVNILLLTPSSMPYRQLEEEREGPRHRMGERSVAGATQVICR
jgi:hypothetical protein